MQDYECERWIVAQKMTPVIKPGTIQKIINVGGQIGGGWNRIHQHICVNASNSETIKELLYEDGFEVILPSECRHPECIQ